MCPSRALQAGADAEQDKHAAAGSESPPERATDNRPGTSTTTSSMTTSTDPSYTQDYVTADIENAPANALTTGTPTLDSARDAELETEDYLDKDNDANGQLHRPVQKGQ